MEMNVKRSKTRTTQGSARAQSPIKEKERNTVTGQETQPVTLKVGQKAPPFILHNEMGQKIRLSDFKGKKVVLYFYPKDDTPGCTKEACSFRDGIDDMHECGAIVLGVSTDSVESHQKFSKKFQLNFPLLSDIDKKVVQAYGVWKEKSLYGRRYMGIERSTFLIDSKGKISTIFPKVKIQSHLEDVLSELELMT